MRVLLFWTSSCFVVRVRVACILFIRRAVQGEKTLSSWHLDSSAWFFCLSLTMKAEREAIMDIG